MIAVVSSTIKPLNKGEQPVSFYSFEERLKQTKHTLTRLRECGFEKIYLVDNSPLLNQSQLEDLLSDIKDVNLYHLHQYQFVNKGVNELLMLLYLTDQLPPGENIFKISGRYYPSAHFKKPDFEDFAVKPYDFKQRAGMVSTRGYWVKDAVTFHSFLLRCHNEIFAYPERVVGTKSFFRIFTPKQNSVTPLNISIEFAAANVLKKGNYKVKFLDSIGIEGLVAGTDNLETIIE